MREDYILSICVIGSPDELKTKMINKFAPGKFFAESQRNVIGMCIATTRIKVDNIDVKLFIVDIASDELFSNLRTSYYSGASAAIMTFDKGDRDSFKAVKKWQKEFKRYIPQPSVPVTLVGFITKPEVYTSTFLKANNEEIYEDITTDEGQSLAEELGLSYYETRPTDKKIIETIFHDLSLKMLSKFMDEKSFIS